MNPREELAHLAEELRAHAEWQAETGATGLPRSARPEITSAKAPPSKANAVSAPPSPSLSTPSLSTAEPEVLRSRETGKLRLVQLAEEVRSCVKCELHKTRTQTVFARGNPEAELCFLGEGPGADEDEQGLPFVGRAGQLLDRMIVAMGFGRDDVYVCNIVKCRPPENRKPLVFL